MDAPPAYYALRASSCHRMTAPLRRTASLAREADHEVCGSGNTQSQRSCERRPVGKIGFGSPKALRRRLGVEEYQEAAGRPRQLPKDPPARRPDYFDRNRWRAHSARPPSAPVRRVGRRSRLRTRPGDSRAVHGDPAVRATSRRCVNALRVALNDRASRRATAERARRARARAHARTRRLVTTWRTRREAGRATRPAGGSSA